MGGSKVVRCTHSAPDKWPPRLFLVKNCPISYIRLAKGEFLCTPGSPSRSATAIVIDLESVTYSLEVSWLQYYVTIWDLGHVT